MMGCEAGLHFNVDLQEYAGGAGALSYGLYSGAISFVFNLIQLNLQ